MTYSLNVMRKPLVTLSITLLVTSFFLMPAMASAEDSRPGQEMNADGKLLLPDSYDTGKEKKCLTVCEEWGEECILKQKGSARTGFSMDRKCRRVCKSFAEECF